MKTKFRLMPETNELVKLLGEKEVGDVVTYEQINRTINFGRGKNLDVQNGARHILTSARRILQNENIVYGTINNIGIKRLDDEEIVVDSTNDISSIRNKSNMIARKISCAEFDNLGDEYKIKHNTTLSVLGAIRLFTKKKAVKRISHEVINAGSKLELGQTLKLFVK